MECFLCCCLEMSPWWVALWFDTSEPSCIQDCLRMIQMKSFGFTLCLTGWPCLRQERIKAAQAKAIILSGGPNSVHVANAPQLPPGFIEYVKAQGIPVLGVCYGMQLLVHVRPPPALYTL